MLKKFVLPEPSTRNINIKITTAELEFIRALAVKYTNGNLSAWMRYAATVHKPAKEELVK